MAGNSKSKRKPLKVQGTRVKAVVQNVANTLVKSPITNFLKPHSFVEKSSEMALLCVKAIVDGKGDFLDWNKIMNRLYAGSIAYTDFFNPDYGISDAINKAVASMHLVMVRTLCTGADGFGFRPTELDRVVDALSVIDTLSRMMLPEELMRAYHHAGHYIDDFTAENKRASQVYEERQAMVKTLAAEYHAVDGQPIELAA